jgi:mono/diheme cytochrome c family protein
VLLLASLAAAAAAGPEQDYALQCRGCHGPTGEGVPGHVPSLRGVAALLETPAGRARLLAVPGVRGASLSDARLAALLGWLARELEAPGAHATFVPLSAEEVARYRGTTQTLR